MSDDFMQMVEEYAALERERKEYEAQANKLKPRIAELREKIIELRPGTGLGKSFKLESGGTVVFSERMTVKVEDKAACADWFLSHNMKEMLSVHSSTLTSFCKEQAEHANPLPDGVDFGKVEQVSLRKS